MKCPFCGSSETKVVDKRDSSDFKTIRRRRECIKCKKRFTTYERVEMNLPTVVKKDGRRERFDIEKVRMAIIKPCEKLPISREIIEKIVNDVENEIMRMEKNEIESRKIGNIIMKRLKKIDNVAYIRFACVYRQFEDIDSFEKELEKLKTRIRRKSK
ncbi:MAG: transcriptional repressor NrdR [Candidatus Micrarchaeota archaeon]|nr:transcriptional repressor NrdR [Candidatus Micrarchaeota archaeon]